MENDIPVGGCQYENADLNAQFLLCGNISPSLFIHVSLKTFSCRCERCADAGKLTCTKLKKKNIHTEREWRAQAENCQFFIISPFDIISSSFEVWNPTHHHHPSHANEIIFISLHAHNLDEVYFSIIFWLRFSHLNSPHPFLPLLSSSQGVLEYLKLDLFLLPHMISYNLHPAWRV